MQTNTVLAGFERTTYPYLLVIFSVCEVGRLFGNLDTLRRLELQPLTPHPGKSGEASGTFGKLEVR
jgi:hypothetical protein